MPKATANLNSFEGGVNRNADPRDIADNESAILWGWNVSDKGVLKLGGGQAYTTVGPTTDITSVDVTDAMAGHGLGFFSADYNLNVDLQRTDYILLSDDTSNIFIHPYSTDTGEYIQSDVIQFGLGGDSPGKIKYYSADGGIRVYDADFNNSNNINKVFLPIQNKYFRDAQDMTGVLLKNLDEDDLLNDVIPPSGYESKLWIFQDSFLDTSNNLGQATVDPGESTGDGTFDTITKPSYLFQWTSNYHYLQDDLHDESIYYQTFNATAHALSNGGTGLGHKVVMEPHVMNGENGKPNLTGVDTSINGKWNYFITYIYDEKQETKPIPCMRADNGNLMQSNISDDNNNHRAIVVGFAYVGRNCTKGSETVWNPTDFNSSSDFTYEDLKTWNPRITGICVYMARPTTDLGIEVDDTTTNRLLYLVHEINMLTGIVRTPGRPVGEQKSNLSFGKNYSTFITGYENSISLLPGETYQSRIGYNAFGNFYEKFKTATVLNRRTYIGNVATLNNDGIVERVYDDRMVKSPVNLFDTFPEENFVDVAINDGDEIIHLEGFSDRILQYKKRNLYIVNVSQDFEFLEGTYEGLGVRHHTQVCKTPQGVAWINKQGCHFYDGRKVVNLINNKIKVGKEINSPNVFADIESLPHKDIFDNDGNVNGSNLEYPGWTAFMTSDYENIVNSDGENVKNSMPSIGYDANSNKLIIIRNLKTGGEANTSGWVYVYDMINASWTFHPYSYEANTETGKTNFITNSKRELVLYQNRHIAQDEQDSSLYRWTDVHKEKVLLSSSQNNNVIPHVLFYKSKDIDFGQPSVRKKIYKVYITYKSSLDTSIKPVYSVNGDRLNMSNLGYRINGAKTFQLNSLHTGLGLRSTGKEWAQVELKPEDSLEANNIFSFQLILFNQTPNQYISNPQALTDFEINDISIVYRTKGIR